MRLLYLPNILTVMRICLVIPIFISILYENFSLTSYLFLIAGISDALDGFLARRFKWTTRFGSIADPLADKLLLTTSFIALTCKGFIPVWITAVVLARDLWVVCGAVLYHYLISHYEMSPSLLSKASTFFQILLVLLILVNLSLFSIPSILIKLTMWLTIISCIASWLSYTLIWGRRAWLTRTYQGL